MTKHSEAKMVKAFRRSLYLYLTALAVLSCEAKLPNGEDCLKDGDCESGYCRSKTCVPVPMPGGPTSWAGGSGGASGLAGAGGQQGGSGGVAGSGGFGMAGTGGGVGGSGGSGGQGGS